MVMLYGFGLASTIVISFAGPKGPKRLELPVELIVELDARFGRETVAGIFAPSGALDLDGDGAGVELVLFRFCAGLKSSFLCFFDGSFMVGVCGGACELGMVEM